MDNAVPPSSMTKWIAWLRKHPLFWLGPLAGGTAGIFNGGIIGAAAGLLLGYFVQVVASQFYMDTAVARYFENPGRSVFPEGEPGIAAYCGLGIYIMFKSKYKDDTLFTGRVSESAVSSFSKGVRVLPLIELFCRIAISRRAFLNPDLLAESLMARRRSRKDSPRLGEQLERLALGQEARREAAYIRQVLDPRYQPPDLDAPEEVLDPYLLLGLTPGASREMVKSAFRKLAVQYHPDVLQNMDEEKRKSAALAFIAVKEAYREIMRTFR
ncbi:MAG: J domain-containing protein [Treponema sp.]|jgi:DnaJ like chaperone protein|nr:J domain-containing protein [Treponema sp.]